VYKRFYFKIVSVGGISLRILPDNHTFLVVYNNNKILSLHKTQEADPAENWYRAFTNMNMNE
jgi:hypothetical protein